MDNLHLSSLPMPQGIKRLYEPNFRVLREIIASSHGQEILPGIAYFVDDAKRLFNEAASSTDDDSRQSLIDAAKEQWIKAGALTHQLIQWDCMQGGEYLNYWGWEAGVAMLLGP